jgi:WD40 repeat protein
MVGHEGPVLCVAVSDDGDVKKTLVATGGVDCTVRVYYLSSGRQRVALSGHTWRVVSICFTDPKFTVGHVSVIASMDVKGEIRLWDRETGNILRVLNAQTPVDRNQLPI